MGIHVVHRAEVKVRTEASAIQCNVCGVTRTRAEYPYDFEQDMHLLEIGGSYGDEYPEDLTTLTFVACGPCLKAWTSTFKVPPEESSSLEYGTYMVRREATHSETGEAWVVVGGWAYPKGVEFTPTPDFPPHADPYPAAGVWEHFKGQRYELLGVAWSYEMEPLVVYRALYGESTVFVRPLSMWEEEVPVQGRDGLPLRRFKRLE